MSNLVWTKEWSASDNGTIITGVHLQDLQNDIDSIINGGLTNINCASGMALDESKIAFDISAGHSHDGVDSVDISALKSVFVGTATRDISVASGTQAITGVGFTPRAIIFIAAINASDDMSIGITDGTTHKDIYCPTAGAGATYAIGASMCLQVDDTPTDKYTGVVSSFDSDGFTITWTKSDTPTGTFTFTYLALG